MKNKRMVKKYNSIILNKFFSKVNAKKQYIRILKIKIYLLYSIKEQNYRLTNLNIFFKNKQLLKYDNLIIYIISIIFTRTNTLLHIINFSGILKFVYSAGSFSYTGKRRKARIFILKSMLRYLTLKLKFLSKKPTALHLKNVGFFKF